MGYDNWINNKNFEGGRINSGIGAKKSIKTLCEYMKQQLDHSVPIDDLSKLSRIKQPEFFLNMANNSYEKLVGMYIPIKNNIKKSSFDLLQTPSIPSHNAQIDGLDKNFDRINSPQLDDNNWKNQFKKIALTNPDHGKNKKENFNKTDILLSGDVVSGKYVVIKKFGQGGYSQVYCVKRMDIKDDLLPEIFEAKDINGSSRNPLSNLKPQQSFKSYTYSSDRFLAMKVEPLNFYSQRLKSEASILKKLNDYKKHFLKFICFDYYHDFSYLLQTCADFDLHEFTKSKNYSGLNSIDTCWLAIEMIESIMSFHRIGYLHRDIKPSNFMVKLNEDCPSDYNFETSSTIPHTSEIILIDFGVSRRFKDPDGGLRKERAQGIPKFRGTNRYCSTRNYQMKELGRVDDFISLYYSIIEISCLGGLPWRFVNSKDETFRMKKHFDYKKYHSEFHPCLESFLENFYNKLNSMTYRDNPNYQDYLNDLNDCLIKIDREINN